MGQDQGSSPEPAWLWEWDLEGEEWCPASSGRVPFKTGFSNCYKVLWQLDLEGGPSREALRNWANWGLLEEGLLSPKTCSCRSRPSSFPDWADVRLRLWGQSCGAAWALAVLLICTSIALLKKGGIVKFMQTSRICVSNWGKLLLKWNQKQNCWELFWVLLGQIPLLIVIEHTWVEASAVQIMIES